LLGAAERGGRSMSLIDTPKTQCDDRNIAEHARHASRCPALSGSIPISRAKNRQDDSAKVARAARFGRVSWKYSSVAYSLILKDVGVLTQSLYIMATEMGLGGCAIGLTNIHLFAKMTGIEFHVEGPVGQFAIGRGTT